MLKLLEPRRERFGGGGWYQRVELDGVIYRVAVERGKRVRIAFKPKGQNIGFHWWGYVYAADGKRLWSDRVGGSTGARGLLRMAGLLGGGQ